MFLIVVGEVVILVLEVYLVAVEAEEVLQIYTSTEDLLHL
jgi:hypothetical protein